MFFENCGEAGAEYINTRDEDNYSSNKPFIEQLWSIYKPYADKHFKKEAKLHFHERFWEMYLGATLIKRGYSLEPTPQCQGPEFYIDMGSRRMWFEAIAPGRGEGNDAVPESPLGQVAEPPQREILLRLTHAIREKHRKYNLYKQDGIIKDDDLYIVAVNGSGICPRLYGVKIPFIVQSLYPAGDFTITLDSSTIQNIDSYHQYRDKIAKINGSIVSTDNFINNEYCGISAVIYSYADPWIWTDESKLGSEFIIIHNVKATNQLQRGFFSFGLEYWAEEQENEIQLHQKDWNVENS